jgi:death-on-curing protein
VSEPAREPVWVSRRVAEAIHDLQIREHGGAAGLRDSGLLESALSSPRNRWAYGDDPDLAELAAAYAVALVRDHPFVDGNKRTAFLVTYVFLALNGYDLHAPEEEVATTMWSLSSGEIDGAAFAQWIRGRGPA